MQESCYHFLCPCFGQLRKFRKLSSLNLSHGSMQNSIDVRARPPKSPPTERARVALSDAHHTRRPLRLSMCHVQRRLNVKQVLRFSVDRF